MEFFEALVSTVAASTNHGSPGEGEEADDGGVEDASVLGGHEPGRHQRLLEDVVEAAPGVVPDTVALLTVPAGTQCHNHGHNS